MKMLLMPVRCEQAGPEAVAALWPHVTLHRALARTSEPDPHCQPAENTVDVGGLAWLRYLVCRRCELKSLEPGTGT